MRWSARVADTSAAVAHRWRMMTQKCVGCRENRSGCRIRPMRETPSQPGCHPRSSPGAHQPAPLSQMPEPRLCPAARPARGAPARIPTAPWTHRTRDQHAMVNASLPRDPGTTIPPAAPWPAMSGIPKEPDPQESWQIGARNLPGVLLRVRLPASPSMRCELSPLARPAADRTTEEPQESWCFRVGGAASRPSRCRTGPAPWPVPGGAKVSGVEVFIGDIRHLPALRYGPIDLVKATDFLARHGQCA
jgi:hypothetical protein